MITSRMCSIAGQARRGSEKTSQYRFVWVAEDAVKGRLHSALEGSINQLKWPHMQKENLVMEVARFEATSRLEDTISRWTQRICSEQMCLNLEVNNFSGTPSHTVFARILDQAPLKNLVTQLRKLDMYLTGNGLMPLHGANSFSLTVAEGVGAEGFENLLYRVGRVEFKEKIQVKKLLLQKKEYQNWITVSQFYFSEKA